MGHVCIALFLNHQAKEISIYPFGFSATINHFNHLKPIEILLILAGGIGFHLIFPIIFKILYENEFISFIYYEYFIQINRSIFLFNLLPIYPLDGGRFLFAILRFVFVYKISKRVTLLFSFIFLIYFLFTSQISMKIILFFLLYLIYKEIKKEDEDYVEYQYYQMSVSK